MYDKAIDMRLPRLFYRTTCIIPTLKSSMMHPGLKRLWSIEYPRHDHGLSCVHLAPAVTCCSELLHAFFCRVQIPGSIQCKQHLSLCAL